MILTVPLAALSVSKRNVPVAVSPTYHNNGKRMSLSRDTLDLLVSTEQLYDDCIIAFTASICSVVLFFA